MLSDSSNLFGCEITVSVSCNNQNATVIIADNGIGISALKLKELNTKTHYEYPNTIDNGVRISCEIPLIQFARAISRCCNVIATLYTPGDVAEMTRWYLQEYPVFVSNQSDELLVIGYPKDSFWT